jgi:hypothetical protein
MEIKAANPDESVHVSIYARWFDETSVAWIGDSERNLHFLRLQQQYANQLLKARGHLFLNEVYDMLGMPRTKVGQVVGWVLDKNSTTTDSFVDFGLYLPHNAGFVNGYEKSLLLDFNVDGDILNKIEEEN